MPERVYLLLIKRMKSSCDWRYRERQFTRISPKFNWTSEIQSSSRYWSHAGYRLVDDSANACEATCGRSSETRSRIIRRASTFSVLNDFFIPARSLQLNATNSCSLFRHMPGQAAASMKGHYWTDRKELLAEKQVEIKAHKMLEDSVQLLWRSRSNWCTDDFDWHAFWLAL